MTSPAAVGDDLEARLSAALAASFDVGAQDLRVAVSIGCVLATPGESMRGLLARADEAMYARKARARAAAAA